MEDIYVYFIAFIIILIVCTILLIKRIKQRRIEAIADFILIKKKEWPITVSLGKILEEWYKEIEKKGEIYKILVTKIPEIDKISITHKDVLRALKYLSFTEDVYIKESQVTLGPISKEAKDILTLADKYGKVLTLKEIIEELDYNPEQARNALKELEKAGLCQFKLDKYYFT